MERWKETHDEVAPGFCIFIKFVLRIVSDCTTFKQSWVLLGENGPAPPGSTEQQKGWSSCSSLFAVWCSSSAAPICTN